MFNQADSVQAHWSVKAGMVFLSIIVLLVLIEIALRNSVEYMPLKYQKYLPTDVRILSKNTKDQLVPESYVALLGDSYAAGWGDWQRERLDEVSLGNPPFHSANVIYEQSGLNVLTFAWPAQGSFDGIAYFPRRYHRRLLSRGFLLPNPSVIIIYFYEGNDLNDNLQFLERYGSGDDLLSLDDVEGLVENISVGDLRNYGSVGGYLRGLEFIQRLYVAKFFHVLATDSARLLSQTIAQESTTDQDQVIPIHVSVGGEALEISGPVEAPPVQLADIEIARAVSVFESSLRYLMRHYSKSEFFIVYIPAPIMSYQLNTAMVPVALPDGSVREYPVSRVKTVSDRVCEHIAEVALRQGATFLDARPSIRAVGQAQMIHGPNDWQHFNELGYKVLGSTVARRLTDVFNNLPKGSTSKPETDTSLDKSHCAHIGKYDRDEAVRGPRTWRTDWN